jgi:hypothetical protein
VAAISDGTRAEWVERDSSHRAKERRLRRSDTAVGRSRLAGVLGWLGSHSQQAGAAGGQAGGPSILAGRRVCVCVIGFINTFDSQSYDTNDFHCKYNAGPLNKKKGYKCVCVCVCARLLPLSKVLVSPDSTAGRGGVGASITGDGGVAAAAIRPKSSNNTFEN